MTLGFALAAVGMDTVTGQLRMTFGMSELMRGFDFLVASSACSASARSCCSMEEGLASRGRRPRST